MKLPDNLKFPQLQAAITKMLDDPNNLGDIYEWGLYNGSSLSKLVHLLEIYGIRYRKIFGIDSFEGLPKEKESTEVFSKFKEGAYKANLSPGDILYRVNCPKTCIIKRWFSSLKTEDVKIYDMYPAKFVHIDCDLYSSTYDALKFMFDNKLIVKGSLISYDEFRSTNTLAGEEKAHQVIMWGYECKCEEVWRFVYRDKQTNQKITQKLFEVVDYD